jgi:Prolyl oligopeptidase family
MTRMPCLLLAAAAAFAQPALRPVPPPGIEVPAADRADLQAGLDRLRSATARLHANPLLPDVLIFQEAVRAALEFDGFYKADEFAKARALLREGEERAQQLAEGHAPWTTATGLIVRGYVSKIDRSVQPYGLVVPPSYSPTAPHRWRLDAWFHGRGETLSEVNFLTDRQRSPGEFTPRDTIVLHLYGRYCNASRFAGEVDFREAMDAVKRAYAIDENRILIRGFSMGGASAWDIGTHYAGEWAAVAPGAGFSETVQYLKLKLTGDTAPPDWEQKLFHLYDAADYAVNLANTATVEYHGEIDPQQQAGDMMQRAMAEEGLNLIRIVGPQTQHKYHPDSKIEINRILDAVAERGRDPYPRRIRFTTWTLAYNRMKWIVVDGLQQHWSRARVDAEITGDSEIAVTTSGVTAFTIDMGPGGCPLDLARKPVVAVDGQKLTVPAPFSDRSFTAHFRKTGAHWAAIITDESGLHKIHGLQGPIDDAFLSSFLFVSPTGTPLSPVVAKWTAAEEQRAIREWRRQFRGDAPVRDDKDVTDADIAANNLILWGDPSSNRILARIVDRLPMKWPAAPEALILIYPNPLNPKKYIVLNSGFTFREPDYLSNARQTPKLPDFAVVDASTLPDTRSRFPGKILRAGFFNEEWQPKP